MSRECFCSFCGKSQREVRKLVAGPQVFICDECHVLMISIFAEVGPPVSFEAWAALTAARKGLETRLSALAIEKQLAEHAIEQLGRSIEALPAHASPPRGDAPP